MCHSEVVDLNKVFEASVEMMKPDGVVSQMADTSNVLEVVNE